MSNTNNHPSEILETPGQGLKQKLEGEMNRIKYVQGHRENGFVPLADLKNIFDQDLVASLRHDIETLKEENEEGIGHVDISTLATKVSESAQKLYGVLLLVKKSHLIVKLLAAQPPVTDKIFENADDAGYGPYCPIKYLEGSEILKDIAEQVFKMQWRIPPVFKTDTDFRFPKKCFKDIQFPFTQRPIKLRSGEGAFGEVSKVLIARGHLKARRYDEGDPVAWKSIRREGMDEERMKREVKLVRDRRHANIVDFFASFWAGQENPVDKDDLSECLHMFFKYTQRGNMHDWMNCSTAPQDLSEDKTRHDFLYKSILDVISGVAFIHREIDAFIAYHHDLKPRNILLFAGNPLVWKICDFGHANVKDADGSSGTRKGKGNEFGTYTYLPPEYFMPEQDPKDVKYGRPFDVFSLGCILLNLATILKFGWKPEGIPKFTKLRVNNKDRLYRGIEAQRREDDSFFNSPKVVEDWRNHLRLEKTIDRYNDLLDLIKEMIETKSSHRIFAWEAEVTMYKIYHEKASANKRRDLLKKVVQRSSTPLNKLDSTHNPYKRAREKEEFWQLPILKEANWSYKDPQLGIEHTSEDQFHSTLALDKCTRDFEKCTLFGRHDIDGQILDGFRPKGGSRVVGLHGLSGMGKSHIAFNYAARFRDKDRRHTFWVDASEETNYRKSMKKIAEKVGLDVSSPEGICAEVQVWLCNKKNEPWFLVIDGLDDSKIVNEVRGLLPGDCGHTLITTKDQGILRQLFERNGGSEFQIFVGEPSKDDRRSIFEWHNSDIFVDATKMETLLEALYLPVRVRSKARSLKTYGTRTSQGYSDIMKTMGRDEKYAPFRLDPSCKTVLNNLFKPITPQIAQRGSTPWPSHELKLLGLMSCLNIERIEQNVLEIDIEQSHHGSLRKMIGILKNLSYISEKEDATNSTHTYSMHRFVEMAVRQCIQETTGLGLVALLERHQTALISLLRIYREKKKALETTDGAMRRSSYYLKLPLMSHFEPFVKFTKKNRMNSFTEFTRFEDLTHSVITFSNVLLEEGRYDDVECVLEFVNKLNGDEIHLPQLRRILAKAYTLSPLAAYSTGGWEKAEELLQQDMKQCCQRAHDIQSWLSRVDLARLYSRTGRPGKALSVLEFFGGFRFRFSKGHPQLCQKKSNELAENARKRIAVLCRIETALAYAVRANLQDVHQAAKTNGKQGDKPTKNNANRKKSKKMIEEAETAYSKWFQKESQSIVDPMIEEGIILTLATIRDEETLLSAKDKLDEIFKRLSESNSTGPWLENQGRLKSQKRPESQKRLWDAVVWRAKLDLESDRSPVSKRDAVKDLGNALKYYRDCFGTHYSHTRKCAILLNEGYEKVGQDESQREDLTEYCLEDLPTQVSFDDVDEHKSALFVVTKVVVLLGLVTLGACVFRNFVWPSLDPPRIGEEGAGGETKSRGAGMELRSAKSISWIG